MKRLLHAVFALSILLISLSPLVIAYSVPPDTIVYVTPTGNKYHREGCSHIKGSATPMTIYEAAEVRELGPCSRCNPDILTGPYVSGDTRSGSSGSSGGSTSPNYPDKYEPPAESVARTTEEAKPTVEKNHSRSLGQWGLLLVLTAPALYLGFLLFLGVFTILRDFLADLFRLKKKAKDTPESELIDLEYKNTMKIEHLHELLSKGHCTNPYTGQPMTSIDDFIAYVERLNKYFEAQQKTM